MGGEAKPESRTRWYGRWCCKGSQQEVTEGVSCGMARRKGRDERDEMKLVTRWGQ